MAQITPTRLRYLYTELLGSFDYALPRCVAFSVAHALYLVEASYRVSDMTCVDQRFFPLLRKGECIVVQSVLLGPLNLSDILTPLTLATLLPLSTG